jgi:hypothetical protein
MVLVAMASGGRATAQPHASEPRWFKGNTHTHTINSDGDSAPDEVVRWYREQRYHFLVLTDHNVLTPVEALNALLAADDRFVVIPGEEITDRAGDKPVHVNALGLARAVKPQGGAAPGDVVRADVDAARDAGGVPQVNHPNFGWALAPGDVLRVSGVHLLEVFNGHPQVNNLGGGGAPGAEALWDDLLTAGRTVFGVASDDMHDLKRPGVRQAAGPGRGWVMVRAPRLAAADILAALARGDFYASTGVELRDVQATPRAVTVTIREQGTTRYRTEFIGKGGRVLKTVDGAIAEYHAAGDEGYVRARVADSNGLLAWTQPVRIGPSRQDEK